MDNDSLYYDALASCAERYLEMDLRAPMGSIQPFIQEFQQGVEDKLPLMKLNRWLGYIQCNLINRALTSVTDERDWTRPLFRPLDFP